MVDLEGLMNVTFQTHLLLQLCYSCEKPQELRK
jgi:hypothetical protein